MFNLSNAAAAEYFQGEIFLDHDVIGRISNLLSQDVFSINAYKDIYKAAILLFLKGKLIDLTSMSAWLSDHGLLKNIGGNDKLFELLENSASTASIEKVASNIQDRSCKKN
tara:strand:- start:313 stop:645 length:333 start_codon:yes stop_codon:yes gene_type:complete